MRCIHLEKEMGGHSGNILENLLYMLVISLIIPQSREMQ